MGDEDVAEVLPGTGRLEGGVVETGQLDRDLSSGGSRYAPRPPAPHKLDPYTGIIDARLEEYPGLSAQRLFDEVRAAGYPGGYSRVRDYVRAVRPREPTESVVRFETPAGRQGQVDFATFTLPWGRRHALVVVLSHSRLLWLCFYRRQTMAVLTDGLERAFARFGGVPKELLFDQMRAVVLSDQRVGGGELVLNAEFLRFAAHWGFHPCACRPYRAQTKGKVERPIRYIRDSFFYGRAFANDEDINEQASRWLEGTANVRRHGTTGERPVDRFERDERAVLLRPLARRPYQRPGVHRGAEPAHRRVPDTIGGAPVVACLRGGGGMTATASDRRDRLRAMLADLKMPGALEAVDGVLAQVDSGAVTAGEASELVLNAQIALRNNRRLQAAMRSSCLPAVKTLAQFNFTFQPSIKREQIESLHELGFLDRAENVILLGPPGVGKTHLAISLAIAVAEAGRRVYYGTLAGLIDSLMDARAAGELSRRLRVLTHPALLVVDEIGYLPVSQDGAVLFFQLINAGHERASTVLTSNKGFEEWGHVLGDEIMAAALIDRLLHHCHIVNIRGNSYRMREHQHWLRAASEQQREGVAT